jgi:hypothetical protein
MTAEEFTIAYAGIVLEIQNTKYSAIAAQLRLIVLVQQLCLTGLVSKEEIIKLVEKFPYHDITNEAQDETLGCIIANINGFDDCLPVFEDLGASYTAKLYARLHLLRDSGGLF